MRCWLSLLTVVACTAAFWSAPPTHDEPPVSIRMRHPWHAGDGAAAFVAEMLEAAQAVWPSTFFGLVARVAALDVLTRTSASPQQLYTEIGAVVSGHASNTSELWRHDEWRASVALHAHAASVEAHYQLFNTSRMLSDVDLNCSFIYWAGRAFCDLDAAHAAIRAGGATERPLPTDHVYAPRAASAHALPTVVLYADVFDPQFGAKHAMLMERANDPTHPLQYVLRWRPTPQRNDYRMPYLSGFGAALHLKKVDYLVIDDRKVDAAPRASFDAAAEQGVAQARASYDVLAARLYGRAKVPRCVDDAVAAQAALDETSIAQLGLAAGHAVLTAADPLTTLREITHNFPAHANGLVAYAKRLKKTDPVLLALGEMQLEVPGNGGRTFAWLNGKSVPIPEFEPLQLLQRIGKERALLDSLAAPEIGLENSNAHLILTNPGVNRAFVQGATPAPRYDASDRIETHEGGVPVIAWRNDLTLGADKWPRDLSVLLQPRWPGQPLAVAHNLFHLVLVPNVTDPSSLHLLAEILASDIGTYGLHYGVVPLTDDTPKTQMYAELLWHAMDVLPNHKLAPFVHQLAIARDGNAARKALGKALRGMSAPDAQQYVRSGKRTPAFEARLAQTNAYLARLGVSRGTQGTAFLNGERLVYSDNVLHAALGAQVKQTRLAAQDILQHRISDLVVPTYFYDLPDTRRAYSALLERLDTESTADYVDFPAVLARLQSTSAAQQLHTLRDFVYHDARPANVSVRLVADFDSYEGRMLAIEALDAVTATRLRLSFVHAPRSAPGPVSRFLYAAQSRGVLSTLAPAVLRAAMADDTLEALAASIDVPLDAEADSFWPVAAAPFLEHGTSPMMLLNGRIVAFTHIPADEITAMAAWEEQRHVAPLLATLDIAESGRNLYSQAVEFTTAVLGSAFSVRPGDEGLYVEPPPMRLSLDEMLNESGTAFHVGPESASLHAALVLDPLSAEAPSLVATVQMLANLQDVRVSVMLYPMAYQRTLPLQTFTQFDTRTEPIFDAHGAERPPGVSFGLLPPHAVLTMQLLAPRTLVTMATDAVHDLDNIRLADLAPAARAAGVAAEYSVLGVLVEGHARTDVGNIPQGLQLLLCTDDGRTELDTIVMESMGYFQFRAQPGLWRLAIRPGRSDAVYTMQSIGAEGWESPPLGTTGDTLVVLSSLGKTLYPVVAKRSGMEETDLVTERDAPSAHTVVPSTSNRGGHADINIFTLASGHLYERMTYIMILSVLRHTQSSVKFWFVENFLSPSFKAFIPHLAQTYHFQYELITYAWPEWLRAQTEKQRMIWAYKILFLDVLFPLDLDRVIFVDADQIVRADLKELVDMDLHGAPYGYPPMGDDSEDMDGFRFWKQGYWRNYLRDLPYHISALYVVDLQRFRSVHAGDLLRRHYQKLTADKNSLANLDQDLPNHLQPVLPIYTLDKTWLWCETWCSYDWLPEAKTIDLCSNPKTKEPKLDRARRQIPEWNVLDAEIARLAEQLAHEHQAIVPPVPVATDKHATNASQDATRVATGAAPTEVHDEL